MATDETQDECPCGHKVTDHGHFGCEIEACECQVGGPTLRESGSLDENGIPYL